jgi:hypothetical protein
MLLKNSENVNGSNAHLPDLLSSVKGAPKGITVGKNHNIASWPDRSNPQPRIIQAGGGRRRKSRRRRRRSSRRRRSNRGGKRRRRSRRKRRSRRRKRRRQRGGGVYGFSPEELPNFGKRSINWARRSNGCGIDSKSNLGAGKQHVGLSQRGGGIDTKGSGLAGIGNAQNISYGYDSRVAELAKELRGGYAPISRTLRPQCAGRRRRRKTRRRRRKRRRRQRGGYHQYQSNKPLTSSYQVGGVDGDWKLANPPPIARKNNCRDNYNHYKEGGSASPVLDQAAVF